MGFSWLPFRRGGGTSVARRWLFFDVRRLLRRSYQKTTTPRLRHFPSFAGGECLKDTFNNTCIQASTHKAQPSKSYTAKRDIKIWFDPQREV